MALYILLEKEGEAIHAGTNVRGYTKQEKASWIYKRRRETHERMDYTHRYPRSGAMRLYARVRTLPRSQMDGYPCRRIRTRISSSSAPIELSRTAQPTPTCSN